MPYPPSDGGSQVMHFTTRGLLSSGVEVKVLAMNPTRIFVDENLLPKDYLQSVQFESVKVDTRLKPVSAVVNLFGNDSYFVSRFISSEFENRLREILNHSTYDIVQLEHLYLCKYIKVIRTFSKAKIVLRPQNIEFVIWQRYLNNVHNRIKRFMLTVALSRLEAFEQNVVKELDGIIALTDDDADEFRKYGNTPVTVVPMGYDYDRLLNYDFDLQHKCELVVYHLGSMDWLPNVEAVEWFLKNVLPILNLNELKVKIIIAGRKMPKSFYRYQNRYLEITDSVENPLEFQCDKQIMIVPLLSGSGIRAKIIEGLALGKTIISTTIGAQGIKYVDGKNLIIADTPEQFSNAIKKCVLDSNLRLSISSGAIQLSRDIYHYKPVGKAMSDFYRQLV